MANVAKDSKEQDCAQNQNAESSQNTESKLQIDSTQNAESKISIDSTQNTESKISKDSIKKPKSSLTAWLPVLCITCGVFVFNTSEFIPIGLLNAISADLHTSSGKTGLLITIYAWVVALASLPLMLAFCRMELKRLMLGVIILFTLSHFLSAIASGYYMLMISRIGVALSHALFWSIASPMAIRVAPKGKQSQALGFIITGSSLAMIVGIPLGRAIGLYLDWRTTFLLIGVISLIIGIFFTFIFPKMPAPGGVSAKSLPTLLKDSRFIKLCFLTAIFITAHFTAYTYIEPFLEKVSNFSSFAITSTLGLFGFMGVVASFLFSKYYDRFHKYFAFGCLLGLWISLGLLYFVDFSQILMVGLCAFWGLCIMTLSLTFQSQVISISKEASMIAMSIYSGIFNVGIGGGAALGGAVVEHFGLEYIGLAGSIMALFAGVYFIFKVPFFKRHRG